MRNRWTSALLVGAIAVAMAGCASDADPNVPQTAPLATSDSPTAALEGAENFVSVLDVASQTAIHLSLDSAINFNDPATLFATASGVVSGRIVDAPTSYVDDNGTIVTKFTIAVNEVFKGEGIGETVSISLPGGSVRLADYIDKLDKLGYYDMKLGRKSDAIAESGGGTPSEWVDPRSQDPDTMVTENYGINPTSESMISKLDPDYWVFYLGEPADGEAHFWGWSFDQALAYVKEDTVYTLSPESEVASFPESELRKG